MGVIYLTKNKVNNRKYIGVDSNNNINYYGSGKIIKLALKKYGVENFTKEILEENCDINYLFEREKYYLAKYNAINSKEFYNLAEGGKGGAGTLYSDESKERHRENVIKSREYMESRKGKTYEEIYGENAEKEKEKRKIAGLGKKYTEERIKKVSDALKGKPSWNKGKKGLQIAWNKGKSIHSKIYILINNDDELIFNGRNELESHIKKINKNKKKGFKINISTLINTKKEKEYNIKIISNHCLKKNIIN